MHALVVGPRPLGVFAALARIGATVDLVFDFESDTLWNYGVDPVDEIRRSGVVLKNVHYRPYVSDPTSVMTIPGLLSYDGIYSCTEWGLLSAALAAQTAGLPSPSPSAVLATRNKYLMRAMLAERGLPQPPYGLVGTDQPPDDAFPVMIKPVGGLGTQGVRRIDDAASFNDLLRGAAAEDELMWESHLEGAQYTVEGIDDGDGFRVIGVTGKILSGPPHYVALEHQSPAVMLPGRRERVVEYAKQCLDALGARFTASHTEIVWHRGEPAIIEAHTRPAGEKVPTLATLTTGWDQYALAVSVGLRTGPRTERLPTTVTAARTVHLTEDEGDPSVFDDPRWLAEFPQVVEHGLGTRFKRDPRWGYAILGGDDPVELVRVSRRLRARVRELSSALCPVDENGRGFLAARTVRVD